MARAARPFATLLALSCLLPLTSCSEARYRLPTLQLRYETVVERRASLSLLRHAWEDRPQEISPEGNHYERGLLNRAAFFGRKIAGTETHRAACDFWMECVREHIERYEEDAHRFRHW